MSAGVSTQSLAPKSPAKPIITAYLANHGHTKINPKAGGTLISNLKRAMGLRHLMPEACFVYRLEDPKKTLIPWDTEVSQIAGGMDLQVDVLGNFPVMSSISHNFQTKTFTLAFCEKCRRLLFTVSRQLYLICPSKNITGYSHLVQNIVCFLVSRNNYAYVSSNFW